MFRKEALAPLGASWVFLAAPLVAVTCYLTVPLLIPVLTTYGLPLGYMADIVGGGLVLALASFVVAVAAAETGSPYAQLGASRAKTFGAITEPVVLFVVFTVALVTGTDLPYVLAYLLEQRDVKRLLAYSSVEHMGILAIGVGFGAPLALAGVLLHVMAHAAAKGNAFFGAGVLVRKYRTKDIAAIRGGLDVLPWTAPLFLLAVLALSAMPPFGLFRSEFQIVAGGLASARHAATVSLVALVTLAFLGLSVATTRMIFAPGPRPERRGEPSGWMVVPMVAGLIVLLVLGVHPPAGLSDLLAAGVAELGGVS